MPIVNKVANFFTRKTTMLQEKQPWQGITITESAAQQICHLVAANNDGGTMIGLRLSIKQSGCAGFGYRFEKICQPEQDDQLYEFNGAKLYVPLKSMPFIDGTELDYVITDDLHQGFKFYNPKAQHACGCGESFGL